MGNLRRVVRSVERGTTRRRGNTVRGRWKPLARQRLAPLATNPAERRESRFYRPAPWGDVELGELLDTGHSPTRDARLKRKAGGR